MNFRGDKASSRTCSKVPVLLQCVVAECCCRVLLQCVAGVQRISEVVKPYLEHIRG